MKCCSRLPELSSRTFRYHNSVFHLLLEQRNGRLVSDYIHSMLGLFGCDSEHIHTLIVYAKVGM